MRKSKEKKRITNKDKTKRLKKSGFEIHLNRSLLCHQRKEMCKRKRKKHEKRKLKIHFSHEKARKEMKTLTKGLCYFTHLFFVSLARLE